MSPSVVTNYILEIYVLNMSRIYPHLCRRISNSQHKGGGVNVISWPEKDISLNTGISVQICFANKKNHAKKSKFINAICCYLFQHCSTYLQDKIYYKILATVPSLR